MSLPKELEQLISKAISDVVSKEIGQLYFESDTFSTANFDTTSQSLTMQKVQEEYKAFQEKYTRDIWNTLVQKYGHTRMLATARLESVQAIEAELDLDPDFRPAWLLISKSAPIDTGLMLFRCVCLCHTEPGFGKLHSNGNRFQTARGSWCCTCSAYEAL